MTSRWPVAAWLLCCALCAVVIARTQWSADVSAFLPRSPSPEQQALVDQLRDGVVSRLILIAVEGGDPARLAAASKRMAAALRADARFASIANGEETGAKADREFLWANRYLLSPATTPEHFSAAGLRAGLEESLSLLGSPAGVLVQRVLPSDPTGEIARIVESLAGGARPQAHDGVWFSPDEKRALLVAQTRAAGYDTDAQEAVLAAIRDAHARAASDTPGLELTVSGPAVFSVATRDRIRNDAVNLSFIASVLLGALMLAVYRSARVIVLGFVPILSGVLAGIAAVSAYFGWIHGITLGFGATLIGEGADYAIYLFTQAGKDGRREHLARLWPTLRLGVLTSICGFAAMFFSGFMGLAQLGLFSIAGLIAAFLVTRWVLPALIPAGFAVESAAALGPAATRLMHGAARLRYVAIAAVLAAAGYMMFRDAPAWSDELAALSPIPAAERKIDEALRRDIGAPDALYLVVVRAPDAQAALERAEAIGEVLREIAREGLIESFDTPAALLPSLAAQRARQAALPPRETLRENLDQAARGQPFRPGLFEPFERDVAAARGQPLLERKSLEGTSFALKTDSLLAAGAGGWTATLPLRGVRDPGTVERAIAARAGGDALFLDLKAASNALYRDYRREAVVNALLGIAAIVALLAVALRSPRRVFFVLLPLAAAVIITAGVMLLAGTLLTIFHLVGLLLVVAVGSNYALFFDRATARLLDAGRVHVSLLFANISTVIGFGILSFSSVPVLQAIGATVAIGAILSLACAAAFQHN